MVHIFKLTAMGGGTMISLQWVVLILHGRYFDTYMLLSSGLF